MSIKEMYSELTAEQTVEFFRIYNTIRPDIEKLREVSTWQQNSPKV